MHACPITQDDELLLAVETKRLLKAMRVLRFGDGGPRSRVSVLHRFALVGVHRRNTLLKRHAHILYIVNKPRSTASNEAPAVLFRYTPDRKAVHPQVHLQSFTGVLQADAYAGFERLYGERIQEAACWAHVRRKFYDIHVANDSLMAAEALDRIGRLYGIETGIRGKPRDERKSVRQARAGPELEALQAWLNATLKNLSQKGELAVAIRYALSRWPALVRYRDDGRLEIDNNAAERALRAVALGRNYPRVRIMHGWRLQRGRDAGILAV